MIRNDVNKACKPEIIQIEKSSEENNKLVKKGV
jgi:hypothetical protein